MASLSGGLILTANLDILKGRSRDVRDICLKTLSTL